MNFNKFMNQFKSDCIFIEKREKEYINIHLCLVTYLVQYKIIKDELREISRIKVKEIGIEDKK